MDLARVLKKINFVLTFVCAVCALLAFAFISLQVVSYQKRKRIYQNKRRSPMIVKLAKEDRSIPQMSFEQISSEILNSNIFRLASGKKQSVTTEAVNTRLSDFKLVGIMWSDIPQAMLENTSLSETRLVREGDMFGKAVVKHVSRSSVTIYINGTDYVLK